MMGGPSPYIVHETSRRIRFRWRRLLSPSLSPEYLEAWIENLPGVESARVNPRACAIVVEYNGHESIRADIRKAVNQIPDAAFQRKKTADPRRRLLDVAVHGMTAVAVPFLPPTVQLPVAVAMGTPAVLQGLDTLVTEGLKVRVLDMATIGFSLLRGDYMAASSISAMIVVGEYLRQATEDRSNGLLKSLVAAPVGSVWVERDGREQAVNYDGVLPGDLVHVGAGEMVPVDGEVRDGEALVDKRNITGEFDPEHVAAGDEITSGCAVIEGKVRIVARRTGPETSMARIAGFMENVLREKSEPERKSDRLADRLTPITLGMGSLLYAVTGDAERALSVLTVDYACSVKLPAPVVVKTSMYAAAKHGVMIKSGSGMDGFAEADALVFDKTGTLTTGALSVVEMVVCVDMDDSEFLRMAASVEDRYGHPVGRAVVEEASRRSLELLPIRDADFSIAHGVSAVLNGECVRVGSYHFIAEDCGIDCSSVAETAERLRKDGMSLVYVSKNQTLLGFIALREAIRDEAPEVLGVLRGLGVRKIVVLTGDHPETAVHLKAYLSGVDEVRAGLMPEDKAVVVRELQQAGYKVAVVGDGVNDAPAFVASDVGVCMSKGTGLARESAQIVLMRDSLEGLVVARRIAERAGRILDRCFQVGVGVNTVLLLAAGAGMFTPTTAAAFHNMTTFSILGGAILTARRTA